MYKVVLGSLIFRHKSYMDIYLVFGREKTGEDSYLIPLGGSNVVGVFGFLTVFDEIQSSVSMHLMKFQFIDVIITDIQLFRTLSYYNFLRTS